MIYGDIIRRAWQRLLRTSALMAGTYAIASTSSSMLSNDRSSQSTAIYISAKTDTLQRVLSATAELLNCYHTFLSVSRIQPMAVSVVINIILVASS